MKKKIVLSLFVIFLIYFVYFRWISLPDSTSISGNTIKLDLPDFILLPYLEDDGFGLIDHFQVKTWSKYDKFSWILGDSVFVDSLEISVQSGIIDYPLTSSFSIRVKPEVDKRFVNYLDAVLDWIEIDSLLHDFEARLITPPVKIFNLDSKHILARRYLYHGFDEDAKFTRIMYEIEPKQKPSSLYRFFRRLPFFLTGDAKFELKVHWFIGWPVIVYLSMFVALGTIIRRKLRVLRKR